MSEDGDKGSGDSRKSEEIKPEPMVPKVPDIELIVDGFGFMPKGGAAARGRSSSIFHKTKEEKVAVEDEAKSPCSSSTNIDIVRRYTWKTKNRMTVQVITYGATITSIQVPDRKGVPDDVLAGFDTLEEYFQPRNPYFGGTIGRYANVIQDGTIVVRPSGRTYMLSTNRKHDHYNGGYVGFDKVNWRSYVDGYKVIMSHVSERFSEGYPGTVMAQVTFEATCDNSFKVTMKCTTSEPTAINLSQAPYFNLAGHVTMSHVSERFSEGYPGTVMAQVTFEATCDNSFKVTMTCITSKPTAANLSQAPYFNLAGQHAGAEPMMDHIFTINADKYTVADEEGIVTGEKRIVGGTPFDFRVPRVLRTMLPKIPQGGYDINFCITQGTEQDLTFQARALHPMSGRVLELYSNKPGMQFYSGNLLPDPDKIVEEAGEEEDDEEEGSEASSRTSARGEEEESEGKPRYGYVPLTGKAGTYYKKHGLFCLMPQNYPDAINHPNFPSAVLNPGEVYVHSIQYKFGILLGKYV